MPQRVEAGPVRRAGPLDGVAPTSPKRVRRIGVPVELVNTRPSAGNVPRCSATTASGRR